MTENEEHADWLLRGAGKTREDVNWKKFLRLVTTMNESPHYHRRVQAWAAIQDELES